MSELDKMSDDQMSKFFLVKSEDQHKINVRLAELEPLLPTFSKMLKKRGVTKHMVYEHYIKQCPDGYKSSAFLIRLNAYMNIGNASLKMEHKAGDKMFVDFTGKKLQIVDAESGEVRDVEVFVAILGCSQLTFVTAVELPSKKKIL